MGGDPDTVLQDLMQIIDRSSKLELRLNFSKCELMVIGAKDEQEKQDVIDAFAAVAPDNIIRENDISLLGSPLTDIGIAIASKRYELVRLVSRLARLSSHQAFFLLRHSTSIAKLTYLLRTTPFWRSMNELEEYIIQIKAAMEQIANCKLDHEAWKKTSLSVRFGGMGLRNVTNVRNVFQVTLAVLS